MGRLRRTTQFLTLILVNIGFVQATKTGIACPFFYCYGCPVAAFACPIGVFQNFVAVEQFPFYAVGLIGLFGLALGRFWCGWGCPFGTLQDLIIWIRRRRDVISLPPIGWSRLAVLAGLLIAAWLAADALFCKVCPAGSLFAAIPQRFTSSELEFGTYFWVHIGTLALSLVAFYLIGRFWCRYLCPLGGALGVFNRVSILKLAVDYDKCTRCKECRETCPVNIAEPWDVENSSSCIRCGRCIDACPAGAIRITATLTGRSARAGQASAPAEGT
jgi:polyferredoxin